MSIDGEGMELKEQEQFLLLEEEESTHKLWLSWWGLKIFPLESFCFKDC